MSLRNPVRFPISLLIWLALIVTGCGGPSQQKILPQDNPTFGPHDGPVGALPNGGAFEVATEPAGNQTRLVVYFYASSEFQAPLSPAPTDVSIDLAMPGNESQSVFLSPTNGNTSRFASDPGDYLFDPLSGSLNANLAGEAISARFSNAQ